MNTLTATPSSRRSGLARETAVRPEPTFAGLFADKPAPAHRPPRYLPLLLAAALGLCASASQAQSQLLPLGLTVGAFYLITDPLAPNWDIEEAAFPDNHYHLELRMKRFYSGGAGEARQIFQRRAKEIMRGNGYISFDVLEYSESLESSLLGSQRVAHVVLLMKRD